MAIDGQTCNVYMMTSAEYFGLMDRISELEKLAGVEEQVPAKKEMITAGEYLKHARETANIYNMRTRDFSSGMENRDLLYADLMEIVNEYCKEYPRSEIVARLRPAIDKINAVLTSSTD